jgi:HEAT repeat protein
LSLLALFWLSSWSACGLALAVLVGLVGYRAWDNWRADARRRERAEYIALLKARAEPSAAADDVLTDLSVDILELVRGDTKARFAERITRTGAAERLHARLRRGGVRTRMLSAAALANFTDAGTQAALTAALDDRNPEVRLTAALSLAADGHAPPPEEVIRRLGLGAHETSLLTVMLLVEMAQTDLASVRALLGDSATAPTVRAATAEALALCDDFAAVPMVGALAIAADPWASELPRYLAALARFRHPSGAPAVLRCLASPVAEVRAAAAHAAGRIGVAAALERLEQLLADPGWWVRFQAAQALLQFGENGEQRLRRIAEDGEEPARETAALTLAEQTAGAA